MYRDILLPVDLGHDSSWQRALPVAVEYCQAFGATLHVMTVIPSFSLPIIGQYFPPDFEQKAREEANRQLHAFVKDKVPSKVNVQHIVAEGMFYQQIIAVADQIDADLIVMARHRPDLKDYLLGPDAENVVRHTRRSVLIVYDDHPL
ncbi:MAG: universal stress protein [Candidatus Competibacterales bacterium]